MRVLICGFTGTILGGIETYVLNMNEHMSTECVFDYIIEQEECMFSERINNRGGHVLFIPPIRKYPLAYFYNYWKILGEEKRKGTRVFYYQLFSMTKLFPAIMAKLRGYRVILHAHNNGLQHANRSYIYVHNLGKRIANLFDFTLFTNSQLSSDFMFGKDAKSEMIFNAVDTNKFAYNPTVREKVRNESKCNNKNVIGFVGRLMEQKNPVFMIQVFAEYLKIQSDSELWVIGEGYLKEKMEEEIRKQKVENYVKWYGRRDDVNELMQGIDVLLHPSLFEGLGIVLIEAQAAGLPVISSADVVPVEAKATELLRLMSLDASAKLWAEAIMEMLKLKDVRGEVKMPDRYQIDIEAKRLERRLLELNCV